MPICAEKKEIPGRFRIDCLPNYYLSFQFAYVDFGQMYIICFVSYAYVVFSFLSFKACALTAQSTVKPLNSGHHWFSEKVSAIERCPMGGVRYKELHKLYGSLHKVKSI